MFEIYNFVLTSSYTILYFILACTATPQQTLLAALESCSKGESKPWRGPRWLRLSASQIVHKVHDAQTTLVKHLDVGRGIAHNEALCENLFMLLVAVLNSIPAFIVGKPESSKSLVRTLFDVTTLR
jgi:hypothetical protein